MASIYREGKGWAARARTSLHRRYTSGFRTHAEARAWARETESAVAKTKQPKGLGPQHTTLAMALRMYAEDFSVKKKGCVQEVCRINRYLSLAQLPRLKATRTRVDTGGDTPRWSFVIEERPASEPHPLPRSFETHRQARLAARPRSAVARQRLATLAIARIAAYDVNELVKAMLAEGCAPATIRNELALLSALFKITEVWEWGKFRTWRTLCVGPRHGATPAIGRSARTRRNDLPQRCSTVVTRSSRRSYGPPSRPRSERAKGCSSRAGRTSTRTVVRSSLSTRKWGRAKCRSRAPRWPFSRRSRAAGLRSGPFG